MQIIDKVNYVENDVKYTVGEQSEGSEEDFSQLNQLIQAFKKKEAFLHRKSLGYLQALKATETTPLKMKLELPKQFNNSTAGLGYLSTDFLVLVSHRLIFEASRASTNNKTQPTTAEGEIFV